MLTPLLINTLIDEKLYSATHPFSIPSREDCKQVGLDLFWTEKAFSIENRVVLSAERLARLKDLFFYPTSSSSKKPILSGLSIFLLKLIPALLQSGVKIETVMLKGGILETILMNSNWEASDIDLTIQIKNLPDDNWSLIDDAILEALKGAPNLSSLETWASHYQRGKQYLNVSLPIPDVKQVVDISFCMKGIDHCIHSGNALRIHLLPLLYDIENVKSKRKEIWITAVDSYNPRECLEHLEKGNYFFVSSVESIKQIRKGLFCYCHSLTKGFAPTTFSIEQEMCAGLYHQYGDQLSRLIPQLKSFLRTHYGTNLRKILIFLLNFQAAIARSYSFPDKEVLEEQIAHLLCGNLNIQPLNQRTAFYILSFCKVYIFLRAFKQYSISPYYFDASPLQPTTPRVFRARGCIGEGNCFLEPTLEEFLDVLSEPIDSGILAQVLRIFPLFKQRSMEPLFFQTQFFNFIKAHLSPIGRDGDEIVKWLSLVLPETLNTSHFELYLSMAAWILQTPFLPAPKEALLKQLVELSISKFPKTLDQTRTLLNNLCRKAPPCQGPLLRSIVLEWERLLNVRDTKASLAQQDPTYRLIAAFPFLQ